MEDFVQPITQFIAAHAEWTIPILFIVAFGESLAFLSLLLPGTTILIAAGTLVPSGAVEVWQLLAGAIPGAILGDSVSYWFGRRFGHVIGGMWPFRTRPELLAKGHDFFERYGTASVFIGRFFGPVRAVIPLVAGMMEMPRGLFWLANVASAIVWAPALLFLGAGIGFGVERATSAEGDVGLASVAAFALCIVVLWIAYRRGWMAGRRKLKAAPAPSGSDADRGR